MADNPLEKTQLSYANDIGTTGRYSYEFKYQHEHRALLIRYQIDKFCLEVQYAE